MSKNKVSFIVDIESKSLVKSLTESLDTFSINNLMDILPKLITHVHHYKQLSGPEKKSLVINMINHIIDVTDGPGNDDIWDPIMKKLVPEIIDTLIKVENKQIVLRKNKGFKRFLSCICN
jgi:hypothetical protein